MATDNKGRFMALHRQRRPAAALAVGYLRRSTSKQEKSLDDQRREIERYAAEHGYTIVRWYQDDGISGDSTEKRLGFQAMHKAACNGRDFDVIICWDLDRFGRFDSSEAGYWSHPLRKAGVRLVTVTEGPIDWNTFAGRIVNAVKHEGKHQYLVDLSRNVARGQITTALSGWLTGQRAPYGYDRMFVDAAGNHCQRVRINEKIAKPRSWHVTLVPSDRAEVLGTLRWMFTTYAEQDIGLRALADQLNAKGIPGPNGGPWYAASIREILANDAYTGTFVWPKRRLGKYHRVALDTVKERDPSEVTSAGEPAPVDNVPEEQIVKRDCWPALVDQGLFDAVQAKLQRRRRSAPGQGYRTHTKANGDRYLLSGLVFCEKCGCKMHGMNNTRKKNGKTYNYPKYVCSTYCRSGKHNPFGCGCHAIGQDGLVETLIQKLQKSVLLSGKLDELREKVRKQLAAVTAKPDAGQLVELRRALADLKLEIDQGTKRLISARTRSWNWCPTNWQG